jgi:hypothetical protein
MGESRRRKLSEPSYGRRPKGGWGIMLVPLFREDGTGPEVVTAATLSAEQLRFGLCFWDRIAWPASRPRLMIHHTFAKALHAKTDDQALAGDTSAVSGR